MKMQLSSFVAYFCVSIFVCFPISGASASEQKGSGTKLTIQDPSGYEIPEAKKKAWKGIKTHLKNEYNLCLEHCGNDAGCVERCKKVRKDGMDRGYQKLLHQTGAVNTQEDIAKHASCTYCGMNRAKFAHSRMYIEYDDGSVLGTCSIHCAAIDMALNIDKSPKIVMVGEYNTKKLIDAEKAGWVIGGSKAGVMTKRPKWAFENKSDAERFTKKYGGELATFEDAIRATFEDMHEDVNMIRKKRKMMRMRMKKSSM
jgi:nitrous oxide reductase accessory protein NosL